MTTPPSATARFGATPPNQSPPDCGLASGLQTSPPTKPLTWGSQPKDGAAHTPQSSSSAVMPPPAGATSPLSAPPVAQQLSPVQQMIAKCEGRPGTSSSVPGTLPGSVYVDAPVVPDLARLGNPP